MANGDDELDRDARAALARYRAAKSPSEAQTGDALARMRLRLSAGSPSIALDDRRRPAWVPYAVGALAIAAVLALAVSLDIGSVLSLQDDDAREKVEAPYVGGHDTAGGIARPGRREEQRPPERNVSTAAAADVPLSDEPDAAPTEEIAIPEEPEPSVVPAVPKRRPAKPTVDEAPDATIAAELALLREAQQAIAGGNAARGLEKINQHARTFPKSQLDQERELARVRALCALGRTDSANAVADGFRRDFPKSHLKKRLDSTCVGEGNP